MPNDNGFTIENGVLTKYTGNGGKVTIPNDPSNKVTKIGKNAFKDCKSLTNITIPNSVKEIGDSAFSFCSSLTKIVIPNSVKEIGKNVFAGCNNLKNVTAPAKFKDTLPERLKKQVTFTVCNEKKQKYTILNSCYIG